MTPKQFAKTLRRMSEVREASWDGRRYDKSWDDVAIECAPEPWPRILAVLMIPEYADIWDWCDSVLS